MSNADKDQDLSSFHSFIMRLDGGGLNDELSELMKKCVREISDACLDRGGVQKASMTLKLEFKMDQKDKVVEIYPTVDEKLPKAPKGRVGMFFARADGSFTRENPRQLTLDDELERQRELRRATIGDE